MIMDKDGLNDFIMLSPSGRDAILFIFFPIIILIILHGFRCLIGDGWGKDDVSVCLPCFLFTP